MTDFTKLDPGQAATEVPAIKPELAAAEPEPAEPETTEPLTSTPRSAIDAATYDAAAHNALPGVDVRGSLLHRPFGQPH